MPPPKAARLSPSLQVFFSLESYAENSELFLQALLIHAAPRKNRTKDADGNTLDTASLPPLSTALAAKAPLCSRFTLRLVGVFVDATHFDIKSCGFWTKSFLLDLFLGFRFYFVASIAVASGQVRPQGKAGRPILKKAVPFFSKSPA